LINIQRLGPAVEILPL